MGCGASSAAPVATAPDKKPLLEQPAYGPGAPSNKPYLASAPVAKNESPKRAPPVAAPSAPVASFGNKTADGAFWYLHDKFIDDPNELERVWLDVCSPCSRDEERPKYVLDKRAGWRTVRIFVSSTFKDFHSEREVLVKEVFPDLRDWCEKRQLHLVDCDLRWGVPKDSSSEHTIRTCLGEIERCKHDNVMPFFLNMTSERMGWIPQEHEVPRSLAEEVQWVFGFSVTEMEMVHAAFRLDNYNSLFLIRNDDFIGSIPDDYVKDFAAEDHFAKVKKEILQKKIVESFPEEQVHHYGASYNGIDKVRNKVRLKPDGTFKTKVFDFFKEKIDRQYPDIKASDIDPYIYVRQSHEGFMKAKCECIYGRSDILESISEYVEGIGNDKPLMIIAGPGSGKTSVMCKAKTRTGGISGGGPEGWSVFYHYVGAVPGSVEVEPMLKRLLKELNVCTDDTMPTDLVATKQLVFSILSSTNSKPIILFIDALNQLNDDTEVTTWIPQKLGPQIRLVVSMINDTPPHVHLTSREAKPTVLHVKPLDLKSRKEIVRETLLKFNKQLDMDQMFSLLAKESSENPLWLSVACEELRVHGQFENLSEKVESLANGLLELLEQVLGRFEQENGGYLLVATLSLLEVSSAGLLEAELLELLGDRDLMPPSSVLEKGDIEETEKETGEEADGKLPMFKWAGVYRALRTFLRPYGDSGEGRLDFYHRSLSKAVRRKYFNNPDNVEDDEDSVEIYRWWHNKLSEYFEKHRNIQRKVEELPHHLVYLKEYARMKDFLADFNTVDELFDPDYSSKLLNFWRKLHDFEKMAATYTEELAALEKEGTDLALLAKRTEKVAILFVQAGLYDESLALAKKVKGWEEDQLGRRDEEMASIYNLLAQIYDQKCKLHEFMYRSQFPETKNCVWHCNEAVELRRLCAFTEIQRRLLGKVMVRLAFNLSTYAHLGGDNEKSPGQARQEGIDIVNEAILIFEQLNDTGHKAEALMTKAVLTPTGTAQLKLYEEAEHLSVQSFGEISILGARNAINTGIYYEENRNFQKAFEYFKKHADLTVQLYGDDHIKAQRGKAILQEPMYKRFLQQYNAANGIAS